MAIERRLTELTGAARRQAPHRALAQRPGGHRPGALRARRTRRARSELIAALMERLLDARRGPPRLADARLHAPAARPAGLPRPPPARLLLDARARRDPLRLRAAGRRRRCRSAPGRSPGSTGTSTATATAAELGFARPSPNSIDAVSNRDFALDYLYAATVCATHLSRLGAEIVIWSSQEFGFCEPADDFASGSSLMPQKKNPDAAELLRAKSPRVAGSLTTLLGVLHALPLAYCEGPAGGQGGAVRRRRHDRALPRGRRAAARRAAASTASGSPRRPATRWSRPPTSPTCWCAGGCRSARRTAWSAGWSARRSRAGRALSELEPRAARRALRAARRRVLRGPARGRVAGLEAVGRRDLGRAPRRAARGRAARPWHDRSGRGE